MRITAIILAAWLVILAASGVTLPNGTQLRLGSNNTTVTTGVLTNGELGYLPATGELVIGDTGSVARVIGKRGVASTTDVNAVSATIPIITRGTGECDFATILLATQTQDISFYVTGAVASATIAVGWPTNTPADSVFSAFVSAPDTVTVRRAALVTVSAYSNKFTIAVIK